MANTDLKDNEYVCINVSRKIGSAGIKRLKEYSRFLELNKDASSKVSKKKINELADEITAGAWGKFKKKHKLV